MTIKKTDPLSLRTINIDGPNGNAFALMGLASSLSKQMGIDSGLVLEEMKSGNYINLLKVFDKYFGHIIILETDNPEYLKELS